MVGFLASCTTNFCYAARNLRIRAQCLWSTRFLVMAVKLVPSLLIAVTAAKKNGAGVMMVLGVPIWVP